MTEEEETSTALALVEQLTDVDESEWPVWEDKAGNQRRATPEQVKVVLLAAHGVSTEVAAALGGMTQVRAQRVLRMPWAKEWLRELVRGRLQGALGVAAETLVDVMRNGRSAKVRSDVAMWLIEKGNVLEGEGARSTGVGSGITLNVSLSPPGPSAGAVILSAESKQESLGPAPREPGEVGGGT